MYLQYLNNQDINQDIILIILKHCANIFPRKKLIERTKIEQVALVPSSKPPEHLNTNGQIICVCCNCSIQCKISVNLMNENSHFKYETWSTCLLFCIYHSCLSLWSTSQVHLIWAISIRNKKNSKVLQLRPCHLYASAPGEGSQHTQRSSADDRILCGKM